MRLFQFFENRLVSGYSGMTYDAEHAMTLSIGWFLMFAPLLWFVLKKDIRKQYHFVSVCLFTGYVFMILPSEYIPWNLLSFLGVLQFPWRLEMIAMMLLSIPAGLALANLAYSRYTVPLLCGILAVQCIIQLQPACERTFGITSETAYEDITEGRIVDPYYSATYMRVELAGGDYIPIGSPDFRDYGTMIRKIDGTPAEIPYEKNGNTLSFHLYTERPEMLMMPLTWYLGYQVYYEDGGNWRRIESYPSPNRMVTFLSEGEGNYRVVFEKTIIKKITVVISCVTLIVLSLMHFLRKRKKNVPILSDK